MSYYSTDTKDERLIGRTVTNIEVNADRSALRLSFTEGDPVLWAVEGDCCSHSWWNDIYEVGALRGGTIREIESVDMPDAPEEDYEVIQVYGYKVHTDKGVATLVFRNASNGYYGGWAFLCEDRERRPRRHNYTEITGNDWSADR